ncbi:PEPxxWA-CTERM sorting domain-containing protein [Phenylobacterium sp.]|uniref:PEPxxWA-CTERM sorting domain-containing protein n=1 Tax=Phenylobacterium sp. TaxID=1871053 RepID=UPI0025CF83A9|nr:PEPxxWA-CTERM sorting domain-containing protein [Phenylobacterium sp.]MBX3483157.1 PEP-CTERM sorting domain-containing protein [Phenylobacterium sp.]MCW5759554.1 PEP-CTERM sorting domain-containing protein [Phenylobacterium sp.]
MHKRTGLALVIGAAIAMAGAAPSQADTIANPFGNGSYTLNFFTMWQSFTLDQDSTFTGGGFYGLVANPTSANEAIGLSLYKGTGVDGELLETSYMMPSEDLGGGTLDMAELLYAGFSTNLEAGVYTLSAFSASTRVALVVDGLNNYADGIGGIVNPMNLPLGSFNFAGNQVDWAFQIDYAPNTVVDPGPGVPEPATWALMIGGFGAAGAMLRRRRIAQAT